MVDVPGLDPGALVAWGFDSPSRYFRYTPVQVGAPIHMEDQTMGNLAQGERGSARPLLARQDPAHHPGTPATKLHCVRQQCLHAQFLDSTGQAVRLALPQVLNGGVVKR